MMRELLGIVALSVALLVALVFQRSERNLRAALEEIEPHAQRGQVYDRLIGMRIDLPALLAASRPVVGSPPGPALVWLLDLDRCPSCFDNIGSWMRLERFIEYDLFLILSGEPTALVRERMKSLQRTSIVTVSQGEIAATLGNTLPSTKVLIDSAGFALIVDSRSSTVECAWSFEGQVGAIFGITSSRSIRGLSTAL